MGREEESRVVTTSCQYDCGGHCILKVRVEDGKITDITSDDGGMEGIVACPKGLAQKDVVYSENRLRHPLKRVGERGSGEFKQISWDEALNTVARELKRVKEQYGTESIFLMDRSGSQSPIHGTGKAARRFFALFGRCTIYTGSTSAEAALFSSLATFGTVMTGASRDSLQYSKLIIMWGWNPLVTRFGADRFHYLRKARERGAKFISVDPRFNISAKALGADWVPIRPGTDAAVLIAMAHVMIKENLCDQNFLDKYTIGFDKFKVYVVGDEDDVPKTPEWAGKISGIPSETIRRLAREYATVKPAALYASWAPGRSAFGEQYQRAASALAAMTCNIGVKGGWVAGGAGRLPFGALGKTLPVPQNQALRVHVTRTYDAILNGKAGGYPSDIKMLYLTGGNILNQYLNTNKGIAALKKPEFIVSHELFLTPTARFSDIILPVSTALEREDIGQPWGGGLYFIHMEQAIPPLPETKSDLDIFTELASRLGIAGYNDKTVDDWLREFTGGTPDLPDYETFKKEKVHVIPVERPVIAFRKQIENPEGNPFPTPSGKIEIFSKMIADMNDPLIPPIPKYIPTWDGYEESVEGKYPLQLVSPHSAARVNSSLYAIPSLQTIADDALWLNASDAGQRGIKDGDNIRVFNGRGQILVKVKVSEWIMPGVVSLDSGRWFQPDDNGLDVGGCVNVLTRDAPSPAGAFPCNSCLVQVEKA